MNKGRFENLNVWQLSIDLAAEVFSTFEGCKKFSVRDQIERAVVSISTNIAEGFEQGTTKHNIKYLYIAKGSAGEVRSLLHLAELLCSTSTCEAGVYELSAISSKQSFSSAAAINIASLYSQ